MRAAGGWCHGHSPTALVAGVDGVYSVTAVGVGLAALVCAAGWFMERRQAAGSAG